MTKITFSIGDYPKAVETIIAGGAGHFPGFVVVQGPQRAWELYRATQGKRIIVVRSMLADGAFKYSDDKDQSGVAAEWWARARPMLDECPPGVWLTVGHEPGVANAAECSRFNDFAVAALGYLAAHNQPLNYVQKVRPVLGNFSQGTPPLQKWDGFNGFSAMRPALQMAHDMGGALGVHQYWIGRFWSTTDNRWEVSRSDIAHAFRHVQMLAESQDYIPTHMPIILTEFGCAPGDPLGWRGFIDEATYVEALAFADEVFSQEPRVLMAAIFQWEAWVDGIANWNSFSPGGYVADHVIQRAQAFPAGSTPPPSPPPVVPPPVVPPPPVVQRVTATGDVYLRGGPGKCYPVVGEVPKGGVAELLAGAERIGVQTAWLKVRYGSLSAWTAAWLYV